MSGGLGVYNTTSLKAAAEEGAEATAGAAMLLIVSCTLFDHHDLHVALRQLAAVRTFVLTDEHFSRCMCTACLLCLSRAS